VQERVAAHRPISPAAKKRRRRTGELLLEREGIVIGVPNIASPARCR
jgi:hypothetical protein